jgi:poly(hydroxyalkanoate) depolymerase family esterase
MNDRMTREMFEATRLTRAGRLNEAAALLQRILQNPAAAETPTVNPGDAAEGRSSHIIDLVPETIDISDPQPSRQSFQAHAPRPEPTFRKSGEDKTQSHLPEALRSFLDQVNGAGFEGLAGDLLKRSPKHAPEPIPDGAQFLTLNYSNSAGNRAYKLYIPSTYRSGQASPLVVMLHGCTQSPDDFAAGTRMNALAEEQACLVAYPAQAQSANVSKCWNWFNPNDQQREQGEPSLIAGITRQIMQDYAVDPRRVYVAGLSAGGAAAAIMAATYPDLYAAVGVHSGLACGAAKDMPSAFTAMAQGSPVTAPQTGGGSGRRRIVPTIVFHGNKDTTVHPRNGDQVIAQSGESATVGLRTRTEQGQAPGGRSYRRTLHTHVDGKAVLEHWVIEGAGHAWAGGSPAGSYTDPRGPDASREMLRFFLDHPHAAAAI